MKSLKILLLSSTLIFASCNSVEFSDYIFSDEEIKALEDESAEIDAMVNTSARKYYETYFKLGTAYYQKGKMPEALEAVKKGLRLRSTDYTYQYLSALIEFELEDYNSSNIRILKILEKSSDKGLLDKAEKLQAKILRTGYEYHDILIPDMSDKYIYLMRLGEIDGIFQKAIQDRIEDEFRIEVRILDKIILPVEENKKDNHLKYFDSVIQKFIDRNGQDAFDLVIIELKKNGPIENIEEEFVRFLYLQEENGAELWEKNMALIQDQYDAGKSYTVLKHVFADELKEPDCLGILAVTSSDIYSGDYNFLFGWGHPDISIMSYNRFVRDNAGRSTEIKRTVMQAFSSTGYLIGIPRCTVPTCARAYPHSLEEHDMKDDILCDECKNNLIEAYSEM